MAWSICITPEGWEEIYECCHKQSKTWLFQAINEARQQQKEKRHPRRLFKNLGQDSLADEAFRWIERTNTCQNGGYGYYIDREGYYQIELPKPSNK